MKWTRAGPRKWAYITKYVDIETGEEIKKEQINNNYHKIKTKSHVNNKERRTEYTTECRRNEYKQQELFT